MNNESTSLDWRNEALNKALPMITEHGDAVGTLLREIRTHRGDSAIAMVGLDRLAMLRFFAEGATSFRSLVPGSIEHYGRNIVQVDESYPYVDWYEVEWQEKIIEVVLPPGGNNLGVICVADKKLVVDGFVRALSGFTVRPAQRCLLYSAGWKSAPDLDAELGKVTWEDIVLPPEMTAGLKDAVEGFFANRSMFASLGFAWRRGVLLVGPPGTGKTMVCKAAAAALPDLPFLYVRDLRAAQGKEAIRTIFERARLLAPCLLAFEDIDGLVTEGNRTVFLNELDGFQNNEGLLIIASSNHPGRIDEALLKRPSRFDRVFHLGLPELAERREYCGRVLSQSTLTERLSPTLDGDALARQVAERTEGFTPAYLKEVFISAALQRAQDGATVLDEKFGATVLRQIEELRQHLHRMKDPEVLAEISSVGAIGLRRRGPQVADE